MGRLSDQSAPILRKAARSPNFGVHLPAHAAPRLAGHASPPVPKFGEWADSRTSRRGSSERRRVLRTSESHTGVTAPPHDVGFPIAPLIRAINALMDAECPSISSWNSTNGSTRVAVSSTETRLRRLGSRSALGAQLSVKDRSSGFVTIGWRLRRRRQTSERRRRTPVGSHACRQGAGAAGGCRTMWTSESICGSIRTPPRLATGSSSTGPASLHPLRATDSSSRLRMPWRTSRPA